MRSEILAADSFVLFPGDLASRDRREKSAFESRTEKVVQAVHGGQPQLRASIRTDIHQRQAATEMRLRFPEYNDLPVVARWTHHSVCRH